MLQFMFSRVLDVARIDDLTFDNLSDAHEMRSPIYFKRICTPQQLSENSPQSDGNVASEGLVKVE